MDSDRRGSGRPDGHGKAGVRRGIGACAAAVAAALLLGAAAPAQTARVAYVVDGDTFRLASGERIRIAGIDAPETQRRQAKCAQELAAGRAATARARALLAGRTVGIERVGRSYNRTVARVELEGRDLATMLVQAGIAQWWPRGRPRPRWCDGRRR
jgi:micrococcal nuclease